MNSLNKSKTSKKSGIFRPGITKSIGRSQTSKKSNSGQVQEFLQMCNSNTFKLNEDEQASNRAPSLTTSENRKISFRDWSLNSSGRFVYLFVCLFGIWYLEFGIWYLDYVDFLLGVLTLFWVLLLELETLVCWSVSLIRESNFQKLFIGLRLPLYIYVYPYIYIRTLTNMRLYIPVSNHISRPSFSDIFPDKIL